MQKKFVDEQNFDRKYADVRVSLSKLSSENFERTLDRLFTFAHEVTFSGFCESLTVYVSKVDFIVL